MTIFSVTNALRYGSNMGVESTIFFCKDWAFRLQTRLNQPGRQVGGMNLGSHVFETSDSGVQN